VRVNLRVTSESDADIEGVYLFVDVPVADYGGGHCTVADGARTVREAALPREKPEARHLLNAGGTEARLHAPGAKLALRVRLTRRHPITVQDNREWNKNTYSCFVRFHDGILKRGETATLGVAYSLSGETAPARTRATVDTRSPRYRFQGFGGNYCFGIESPVTAYTLANLHVGCARTEMTISEWEPRNDNDAPDVPDWEYYTSRVKPGSNLEREFELMRAVQDLGVPWGVAAWRMPKWLHEGKRKPVKRALWGELIESIETYLIHAKRTYGVEPHWFSFNEPDWGVDVKFSPEEHRDFILMAGRRFAARDLRTRLMLADVTNPRGTHTYAAPTVAHAEARSYVNSVAFHSWGGASDAQYAAWGDLAEQLGVPLYVTEAGVDAGAWRTSWVFDTHRYAMREVTQYQRMLLHARPAGTMHWEFTSDYGLAKAKGNVVTPTTRFWFMKHFCDLTPTDSDALATTSDSPQVLVTAFVERARFRKALCIHVANTGGAATCTLSGLPRTISSLYVTRTSETDRFAKLPAVRVASGAVELELPPQSLTTLTTVVAGR
jgi:O-glycosyl hydrolase